MSLPRAPSTEFHISKSFDGEKWQAHLEAQREDDNRKNLSNCLQKLENLEKQVKEISPQDYKTMLSDLSKAIQHFKDLGNRTKADEMTLLQLYSLFNRIFLKATRSKLIEWDADWLIDNGCQKVDYDFIKNLRTKYPDDAEVTTALVHYWFHSNRAAFIMFHAWVTQGMLDPANNILFFMNELLVSFPDHYFTLKAGDQHLLCWAYDKESESATLDQSTLDGLGFTWDYEALRPGRSCQLMLNYIMIRIFNLPSTEDLFFLHPNFNNAISTLRGTSVDISPELNKTFQLFRLAWEKAFRLAKTPSLQGVPAINADVRYTLSQLSQFDEIINPYFRIKCVPVVKPSPSLSVNNGVTKFACKKPATTMKTTATKRNGKNTDTNPSQMKLRKGGGE